MVIQSIGVLRTLGPYVYPENQKLQRTKSSIQAWCRHPAPPMTCWGRQAIQPNTAVSLERNQRRAYWTQNLSASCFVTTFGTRLCHVMGAIPARSEHRQAGASCKTSIDIKPIPPPWSYILAEFNVAFVDRTPLPTSPINSAGQLEAGRWVWGGLGLELRSRVCQMHAYLTPSDSKYVQADGIF